MSIALSEFWTRLVRLGLADSERCRTLAAGYSHANGGSPPTDSVHLARFLISSGELTKFQAKRILSDDFRKLRLATFVQRSDETSPPLSRWMDVQSIAGSSETAPANGKLLRLHNDPTAFAIAEALQRQSSAKAPTIQSTEIASIKQQPALVFSPLPPGRSLEELLEEKKSLAAPETLAIVTAVCDALTVFHAAGLVHQEVQADRVWVTDTGSAILLRSLRSGPLATAVLHRVAAASLTWLDDDDYSEFYLAPEAARDQPTASSDVYALGCLFFRMLIGRRPIEGKDSTALRIAHEHHVPPEITECVAKGDAGDPLMRVLTFAMAKNPQARFQDAGQLMPALLALAKTYTTRTPETKPTLAPEKPVTTERLVQPEIMTQSKELAQPEKVVQPKPLAPSEKVNVSEVPAKPVASDRRPAPTGATPNRPSGSASAKPVAPAPAKPSALAKPSAPAKSPRGTTANVPVAASELEAQPARVKSPAPTGEKLSPALEKVPAAEKPLEQIPVTEKTPLVAEAAPAPQPAAAPTRVRRRRKKQSKAPLVIGGLGILLLLMVIVALVRSNQPATVVESRPRPQLRIPPPEFNRPTASTDTTTKPPTTAAGGYELVDSDKLLWVPPYASTTTPPPLSLLPPGPGGIVSIRLSRLATTTAGSMLVKTLTPELPSLIEQVTARTKVSLEKIERCTVALHPGAGGKPIVTLAIVLVQPEPLAALQQSWGVSPAMTPEGEKIFAGDDVGADAYYVLPGDEETTVRAFAVGPLEQIQQVASVTGGPIPLTPNLASLWKSASETSDLTALFTPNFLLADARSLLESSAPSLREPLRDMWIPSVNVVMLTAAIDDSDSGSRIYLESRMAPSGGVNPPTLMNSIRQSVGGLPKWGDDFIVGAVPDPSWRLLANRLPMMLKFTGDQIRYGLDADSVVLNAYMPANGFSQLTLASLLAMNTPSGGGGGTMSAAPTATTEKLTVDQMLDREMSISFDQESLEFAIAAVVQEFGRSLPPGNETPPMRIIGGDLQKMGITQNQQIRNVNKQNIPLRTVLSDLMFAANPDKTATSTHDPKQALIWVVAEDPQAGGKRSILVTTREAANGKYELPKEFQPE